MGSVTIDASMSEECLRKESLRKECTGGRLIRPLGPRLRALGP